MTIALRKPIAQYYAADRLNGEAVAKCFTSTGVVQDDGTTYTGWNEINQWKTQASTKYRCKSEPIVSREIDGGIVVTTRLVGNFPGSPATARYYFTLDGQKVSALRIA